MNNNAKKISFSFTKTKKNSLNKKINKSKEAVEFVSCFDNAKMKIKSAENNEIKQLIIPLTTSKKYEEVLQNRIKKKNECQNLLMVEASTTSTSSDICKMNFSNAVEQKLTELAATEILSDAQNTNEKLLQSQEIVIQPKKPFLTAKLKNDNSDIDYELVPVTNFGYAMLRGMGWKPNNGIGKNPKLVPTTSPKLRPKGLGLGVNSNCATHSESK